MTDIFKELDQRIDGDVYTDLLRRYLVSTDGSIFRKEPVCAVYPRHAGDVTEIVAFAKTHGLSVHPRGAGSGLCGSALGSGIVVDFTRYMNRLIHLDIENKTFTCEPGYRFGQLEAELKGRGLFFPPDPSSGEYASFGGMAGTNASGAHSVKYGNVSDYILDADLELSDGCMITLSDVESKEKSELPENLQALSELYIENKEKIESAYPNIRYNVAGYNLRGLVRNSRLSLKKLIAGAEGTLGIATRLQFKLLEKPPFDSLVVAFFDDIVRAAKAVQMILPMNPSGIEVMDKSLLNLARESDAALRSKIPQGIDNVLLIEFDAFQAEDCARLAEEVKNRLETENLTDNAHLAVSAEEKQKFWAVRKAAVPILYKLKGEKKILALIEDAVVPVDKLVDYFEGIYAILNRHKVSFVTYGHIAKGLLHTRPLLNLKDSHDVGLLKILADDVFELVHSLGGSVSGEHGDGRLRSAYIIKQYPEIYGLFLETKALMDPEGIFNPEIKTVHDPEQMEKYLRFGVNYSGTEPDSTLLNWPEGFSREAEKCHGCSKCTTITTATRMCPVYKFTRDETASPKAKANLLRGLISGVISNQALYEKAFQQVMEQCVNCGSCHKECPSAVNIPKLSVEAKAQYTERFGASLENRLLTSAELAGRLTRKVSGILKPVMELSITKEAAERFAGISAQRDPVVFPSKSLFERIRPVEGRGDIKVLYFTGCYAGYIRPEIGEAAVKVLKRLGMTVFTPPQHCCGLPMLSKGMTDQASAKVKQNLLKWRHTLNRADHVAVTCSSCGLSLMQEWDYLMQGDEIRQIREKMIHISSLVEQYIDRISISSNPMKIAYHNPCHLRVQPFSGSSVSMMSKIPGLEVEDLNSHCCGMAGSWGMTADHFDLSRKIGSEMIGKLNRSEAAAGVTDCPTCRMQMEQFGDKEVKHPVEVLAACL